MTPYYITRFVGEYRFLSNFHYHVFRHGGVSWTTSEHAYQASKTRVLDEQRAIRRAERPNDAKRLGRRCQLRDDWEESKDDVMLQIVRDKFADDPIRTMLLDTGDAELLEGNYWGDEYWGVCQGEGLNKLGRILMRVREEAELPW